MNWIFGDNINTDLITPGRYNITTDTKELASIAFIEYRPEFAKNVKKGDFIIAGNNFGYGSSRETAVIALKACGIEAIIAKSFARIFYRNCFNNGFLAVIIDTSSIGKHDRLILDVEKKTLINKTKDETIGVEIPDIMMKFHQEGGVISFIKKYGFRSIANNS